MRSLSYLKRYRRLTLLCFIASLAISFFHFASLCLVKPLGDLFLGANENSIGVFFAKFGTWGRRIADILNQYVWHDQNHALYFIALLLLLAFIAKNACRFCSDYLVEYLGAKAWFDILQELFAKTLHLPIADFAREGPSQITSRLTRDTKQVVNGIKFFLGNTLNELFKISSSLLLVILLNWQLALSMSVTLPIILVILKRFGRALKRESIIKLAKSANILAILQESFHGIQVVKAQQLESYRMGKLQEQCDNLLHTVLKAARINAVAGPAFEVTVGIAGIGVLLLAAPYVFSQQMSSGSFLAFHVALATLVGSSKKLVQIYNQIAVSCSACERVFELLDAAPEHQDSAAGIVLGQGPHSIAWQSVNFSYSPHLPVLRDVSFTIEKGERIALVGPSGSGKSTLISLLLRLYDIDSGTIAIDSHNIRDITCDSLRREIGLVTQEPFLFNDTIAANISPGDHEQKKQIEQMAKMAHADLFIAQLEKGYGTVYGKGGIDLSGGQKHRLCLARALIQKPGILIIDEALAHLDSQSEVYIKKTLDDLRDQCTVLIATHRFSTIEKVDRILVLAEGRVDSFGTHEQLLQSSGIYRNLYNLQNDE